MSHVWHELADEFPDDHEAIHQLKVSSPRYQTLAEAYHGVNRQIHRIEAGVEPTSDEHAAELKKTRLKLLDDVASLIGENKAGSFNAR